MWGLPVEDLFCVGNASSRKLHNLGIQTIGDLAHFVPDILRSQLKSHGPVLWNYANGHELEIATDQHIPNKASAITYLLL